MNKKRRGTVILETDKGILLTAMRDGEFLLPGGGADKGESRFRAANCFMFISHILKI